MLPDAVSHNAIAVHGDLGRQWIADFPAILVDVCARWGLTDIRPFADLSYHFVARATRDGESVVAKLGVPSHENRQEVAALRAFDGVGSVRLLDALPELGAILLEDLSPAETLQATWSMEADAYQTTLLAKTMVALWRQPTAGFPSTRAWADVLDTIEGDHVAQFPMGMLDAARVLWNELEASAPSHVLLHGDLHHGNVLVSNGVALAIDPMGVVGDPAFESYVLLRNPLHATAAQRIALLEPRIAIIANYTLLKPERLRRWAYCGAVMSACWDVDEDGARSIATIAIAEALRESL